MIRHEDAHSDEEGESCDVDIVLDLAGDGFDSEEAGDGRVDREEEESSAVECGEWKEIEDSEIYADERGDDGDDCDRRLGVYELDEETPDRDRSAEAFDRVVSIGRCLWDEDLAEEITEELESKLGLMVGLRGARADGTEESVPVAEVLIDPEHIIPDIAPYFSVFGCDRDGL